ncbi:molybdate ABC transporter substrate-binding protein [Paraglaciecola aquimarina]|uniref:Molybdate ABC transporter substrate-binding protein n=1 Tax=Paraglaciecola aquimarina TaxID=1235557 RepID=A0ABU3SXJ0_9ALTE|nr:molybdate ABC transporter substrate-binding protein [Paraglaciecola aquimarina]MDU0354735.1 molybdate ABC transporter substrate-binding protein [Paraglaciecola aquimarina]
MHAEVLHIAVASNFSQTIKTLVATFEKTSAHSVRLSFASSGKIYAQIKHGAPFDVFFSADNQKSLLLEAEGLTVEGSRYTYALGQLVLWANNGTQLLDVETRLLNGNFRKLALANPNLAPYGLAAQQTIENLGLTADTQPKWVQGENIMQTYQFIHSGNADLGFVALSQVYQQDGLSKRNFWLVPDHLYANIQQDLVWLKRAQANVAAREFLDFMRQTKAQHIIQAGGYKLPENISKGGVF